MRSSPPFLWPLVNLPGQACLNCVRKHSIGIAACIQLGKPEQIAPVFAKAHAVRDQIYPRGLLDLSTYTCLWCVRRPAVMPGCLSLRWAPHRTLPIIQHDNMLVCRRLPPGCMHVWLGAGYGTVSMWRASGHHPCLAGPSIRACVCVCVCVCVYPLLYVYLRACVYFDILMSIYKCRERKKIIWGVNVCHIMSQWVLAPVVSL